jgi:hypothetical protein
MKKSSVAGILTIASAIGGIVNAILDYIDEMQKEKRLHELELKVAKLEAAANLSNEAETVADGE